MKHWTNARPNGIYLVENLIIVKEEVSAAKNKKNDPQNNQRILY